MRQKAKQKFNLPNWLAVGRLGAWALLCSARPRHWRRAQPRLAAGHLLLAPHDAWARASTPPAGHLPLAPCRRPRATCCSPRSARAWHSTRPCLPAPPGRPPPPCSVLCPPGSRCAAAAAPPSSRCAMDAGQDSGFALLLCGLQVGPWADSWA